MGIAETLEGEWKVDRIWTHVDCATQSQFEIEWTSRDVTWIPYDDAKQLVALQDYLDVLGIKSIEELTEGRKDIEPELVLLGLMEPGLSDSWKDRRQRNRR